MPYDFSSLEIPVFSGINDLIVAPTSSKGGSAGHLINLYNQLIELAANALNELEDAINSVSPAPNSNSNWIVATTDYTAQSGDRIIAYNLDGNAPIISLPNPEPGAWATVMSLNDSPSVGIDASGGIYRGSFISSLSLDIRHEPITFIWINESLGWVPSKLDIIIENSSPS